MAFPYTRANADWKNADSATGGGDESTPLNEAALDTIEAGIKSISDILALVDAKGDLLVGSAADAYARLAVGNQNEVLGVGASSQLTYSKIVDAMIDAAAAIAISKLAGYPSDATKVLKGDGSWGSLSSASLTAALPGSPTNGDEIILVDSLSAPTYAWHFRYISAKTTNKWQFIGGPPAYAEVVASESTSSLSYTALTTAGPSIAVPVAGDYIVTIGAGMRNSTAGGDGAFMSYDIGGTGATDADKAGVDHFAGSGAAGVVTLSRENRQTGLTAVTLTSKYRAVVAGTAVFEERYMMLLPIAIGG